MFLLFLIVAITATEPLIVCYYRYNDPPPSLVPGHICTHIILIGNTIVDHLGHFQDLPKDIATQFVGIKDKFPKVKLLLCVTGENRDFSFLVSDDHRMTRFANESSTYLRRIGLDGLDIDWEFPSWSWDAKRGDKYRFTTWLKIMREHYGNDLLLTAAVSGPPTITRKAYEIIPFNHYLDYVNVMNYDFHVFSYISNPFVGFNAPLHKLSRGEIGAIGTMNSAASMNTYHQLGLWSNKTLFGIPTYNLAYLLVNYYFHKPYSLAEKSLDGYEKRATICELLKDKKRYKYVWNKRASSPYIYGIDKTWISAEDERSILEKTNYAMQLGVAGVMVFHIGADDVYGSCGNGTYPLLTTIQKIAHSINNKA